MIASAGEDGGSPVAFLPAGAQIALRVDMDRIRAFYETVHAEGRFRDHVGPIRLKDEG